MSAPRARPFKNDSSRRACSKMSLIFSLSASKRCHKPHAGSCCPMRHLVKAGFAKDVTEPRARDGHSPLAVSQKMSRPLAIPGGLAFRILLSVWLKMSRASILQTAFLNKALFDRRDVRLGIAKRVRRRVDRVVAEDEIVLVRSGRGGRAPNRLPAHLGGPGRC